MKTTIPEGAVKPHLYESHSIVICLDFRDQHFHRRLWLDPRIPILLDVVVASLIALRCAFPGKIFETPSPA